MRPVSGMRRRVIDDPLFWRLALAALWFAGWAVSARDFGWPHVLIICAMYEGFIRIVAWGRRNGL